MLELDVYEPLANWLKTELNLEWAEVTHENPCIFFNDADDKAEVDLILGNHKRTELILTDVVHVKTKVNLKQKKDRYELLGKTRCTLNGAPKVWVAIEKSTYGEIANELDIAIGIITYDESGKIASQFRIKRQPIRSDKPKYLIETQHLINRKFSKIVETSQYVFVCSLDRKNWEICKRHKLWGLHHLLHYQH